MTVSRAFNYVTAEKSPLYRAIMGAFAAAKRHFVVHLRPEDVEDAIATEGIWRTADVPAALAQLTEWGNLIAQPDTGRVTTVEDFYRARYLYQLSRQGEAAEAALGRFEELMGRHAALQSVALHDIRAALAALILAGAEAEPDPGRVHALLRDLSRVFADLAENAQAFMAGLARTLDLRAADRDAFLAYKRQIIEYLERFLGDLVVLSADIARSIGRLDGSIGPLLDLAAERVAADHAPDAEWADEDTHTSPRTDHRRIAQVDWRDRWSGLKSWFVGTREYPSQAMLLQSRTRRAISQLLETVVRLNEQRLGRSDRSADFRVLARWFLESRSDGEAHRLWRAAFGLTPARHLSIDEDTLAIRRERHETETASWWTAAPVVVNPRLRTTGSYARRGPGATVTDRAKAKAALAGRLAQQSGEIRKARRLLATGQTTTLSAIASLDEFSFRYFLGLLGEALAASPGADATIHTVSSDGAIEIKMTPLPASTARIETDAGIFSGNDYRVCFTDLGRTG